MAQKRFPLKNKTHMKKGRGRLPSKTARRLAEEVARRAEAMLAESQRISHLGSWDWDMSTDKIQFSDEMFRLVGMVPGQKEITGEEFVKYFHPEEADQLHRDLKQGVSNQYSSIEHQIVLSNGEIRHVQTRVKAYKDENGVPLRLLGSTQDVTDQKRIQEALEESEWRNRIISELTTDYVFIVDVDSGGSLKLRWASENMVRMTGRLVQEVGMSELWGNIFHPDDKVRFFDFITQTLSTAEAGEIECRTFHKDGHERWVQVFARPQVGEGGKVNTIIGAVKDITSRKQMEGELRESDERFRLLLKNAPVSVAAQDRDLRYRWSYNQRTVGPSFIIGKTDTDLFPMETAEQLIALKREVLHTEKETRQQLWVHNGNKRVFLDVCLTPMRDSNGQVIGVGIATVDLTQSELAEKALRASEEKYRFMVEHITDVVWQISPDLLFTYSSPADERQRGYTQDEVVGRSIFDFMTPDSAAEVKAMASARWAHQQSVMKLEPMNYEIEQICKDGRLIWTAVTSHPIYDDQGQLLGFQGITSDITERKKMEDSLRDSEEKYRFMVERIADVVWQVSLDMYFTYVSPVVERQSGFTPDELIGRSIFDFMTPDSAVRLKAQVAVRESEERSGILLEPARYEIEQVRKDGQHIWEEVISHPIYDAKGRLLGFQGLTHDITERKQIENALRESEARNRAILNAIPDLMFIQNREGVYVDYHANDRLMLIAPPDEFLGRTTREVLPPELEAEFQPKFDLAFQTGEIQTHEYLLDVINGKQYFESRMIAYGDNMLLSIVRDITERKRTEEKLAVMEGLQSVLLNATELTTIVLLDCSGTILTMNEIGAQRIGKRSNEVLGRLIHDFYPKELAEERKKRLDEVCSTGQVVRFEDSRLGFWYENSMYPIFDEAGKVIRVAVYAHDITERKKAEQKKLAMEEFQNILLNATKSTSIVLLDCEGTILTINDFGAQLIGKNPDELLGRSIFDIYSTDDVDTRAILDARKNCFDEVRRTSAMIKFEEFRYGGWFEHSYYPIFDSDGEVVQIAIYARDITERKNYEEELRASEQRYRALAEASPDMIFVVGRDDKFTYVNDHVSRKFGVQVSALIGQPRSNLFGASDLDRTYKNLQQVFESGKSLYAETQIGFLADTLSLSTWLVPLKDQHGSVEHVLGVSRDISDLKNMEFSLKEINQQLESRVEQRTSELLENRNHLRRLTQQIVTAQEEERRRISRELHDEAGQTLIGLRFSLDAVYRDLPASLDNHRQRMEKAMALTDETLERLRKLAYNLRPPALELLGINLVIKELCREFSDQTGIKVEYSGVELENLKDEISISLYRFVQEALTNIAKHANAKKVKVTFECEDNLIKMCVQDNGWGIPKENASSGIGLVGIKERFDALGGTMEIKPVIPSGMQIQVCVPWKDN